MTTLLTEAEVARLLGLSPRTLRRWRHANRSGPPFVYIGGRVRYRRDELEAWLESQPRYRRTREPIG